MAEINSGRARRLVLKHPINIPYPPRNAACHGKKKAAEAALAFQSIFR